MWRCTRYCVFSAGAESVATKRLAFWNGNGSKTKILYHAPWLWYHPWSVLFWRALIIASSHRHIWGHSTSCAEKHFQTLWTMFTMFYKWQLLQSKHFNYNWIFLFLFLWFFFSGEYCETEINECGSFPCQHNGTCVDLLGHYTCRCPAGMWKHDLKYTFSVFLIVWASVDLLNSSVANVAWSGRPGWLW